MRRYLAGGAAGAGLMALLSGCGQIIDIVPGQSTPLRIGEYQCTYRTDTTTLTDVLGQHALTHDHIACQNGADYACGDRDRPACIAHVDGILRTIPKDDTPPGG